MERGITEKQVADAVRMGNKTCDGARLTYEYGRVRVVMSLAGLVITAYRRKRWNPKRIMQKRRSLYRQYARRR